MCVKGTLPYIIHAPHSRATQFEIHTPPVENFGKVSHRGVCVDFQMHSSTFCVIFRLSLSQREYIFYSKVPNELIYLEFTLPLWEMFLKSSTGGV